MVLHASELERFAELARGARPEWLLLAFALQVVTYACTAAVWRCALGAAGERRPLRSLIPLGLAKVFTDQALPTGGLSGTVLLVHGLARRGIPAAVAGQTLLVALVSFYAAYFVATLAALGVLWIRHQASPLLVAATALLGVISIGAPVLVLTLRRWSGAPEWLGRLPAFADLVRQVAAAPGTLLRDARVLGETLMLQLAVIALDALTFLVVFLALGQPIAVATAFVSFMAASVAATIGPVPLGLGTFEGSAVAMLSLLGVDVEAALAATLLLRGLTFWLPMIPGLWLARREIAASAPKTD